MGLIESSLVYPKNPIYEDFCPVDSSYFIHPDFRYLSEKTNLLGKAFIPYKQAKYTGVARGGKITGVRSGQRTASFPEECLEAGNKRYFVDRKGIGSEELSAIWHSIYSIPRRILTEITGSEDDYKSISLLSLSRHSDWEYLDTPHGGHNYDHIVNHEFQITSCLRPTENGFELAENLYVCPVVAAVEVSRKILTSFTPEYRKRLYPGRVGQSIRLVPGFHRMDGMYSFEEMLPVEEKNRESFIENYLKGLLAFSTMGARTMFISCGHPRILYSAGQPLQQDIIIDSKGNIHLADVESFGTVTLDFKRFDNEEAFLRKEIKELRNEYDHGLPPNYEKVFFNKRFFWHGLCRLGYTGKEEQNYILDILNEIKDKFVRIEGKDEHSLSAFVKILDREFKFTDLSDCIKSVLTNLSYSNTRL